MIVGLCCIEIPVKESITIRDYYDCALQFCGSGVGDFLYSLSGLCARRIAVVTPRLYCNARVIHTGTHGLSLGLPVGGIDARADWRHSCFLCEAREGGYGYNGREDRWVRASVVSQCYELWYNDKLIIEMFRYNCVCWMYYCRFVLDILIVCTYWFFLFQQIGKNNCTRPGYSGLCVVCSGMIDFLICCFISINTWLLQWVLDK